MTRLEALTERGWFEGFTGILKLAAKAGLSKTTPYPGSEKAPQAPPVPVPEPIPGGESRGTPNYLGLEPGSPSPTIPQPPFGMPVLGSGFGSQTKKRNPEQGLNVGAAPTTPEGPNPPKKNQNPYSSGY